jgi:hypothetical protein
MIHSTLENANESFPLKAYIRKIEDLRLHLFSTFGSIDIDKILFIYGVRPFAELF